MGKSIRSKIKRKHRSEFRATIGDDAYQANMKETQTKLKDCIEQQTLKSLSSLSSQLGTDDNDTMVDCVVNNDDTNNDETDTNDNVKEISATTTPIKRTMSTNVGENKAVVRRKIAKNFGGRTSYREKIIERKNNNASEEPKKRPKYFCQF